MQGQAPHAVEFRLYVLAAQEVQNALPIESLIVPLAQGTQLRGSSEEAVKPCLHLHIDASDEPEIETALSGQDKAAAASGSSDFPHTNCNGRRCGKSLRGKYSQTRCPSPSGAEES